SASDTSLQFRQEAGARHAERFGEPRPAARDITNEFRALRPGRTKPHGSAVALKRRRDVGEIAWLIMNFQVLRTKRLEIRPQIETVEVDIRSRALAIVQDRIHQSVL